MENISLFVAVLWEFIQLTAGDERVPQQRAKVILGSIDSSP